MLVFTQPVSHIVVPPPHVHSLFMQVWPASQALPQLPQFATSMRVFTHAPSHIMPVGHAHTASRQTSPPGHIVVQLPQCVGSVLVFVHTPVQSVVGPVHAQLPSTQTMPPEHASPQPPQLRLSVSVSTQLPAHAVVSVGQSVVHADAPQTSPAPHAVAQSPQCVGSLVRS